MKAVILAGGLGTRLRPLTYRRPKGLVPLFSRSILEHQIHWLKGFGITEVILALYHQAYAIRNFFGEGRRCEVKLEYVVEDQPMGTAGALRNAAWRCGGQRMVVLNGDVLADLNLKQALSFHLEVGALATICLACVKDPGGYGVVSMDDHYRVTSFLEKPSHQGSAWSTVNAGIYILEPGVIKWIKARGPSSLERDVYPALIQEGLPVYGYQVEGSWIDVGTLRTYLEAHRRLLDRQLMVPLEANEVEPGVYLARNAPIRDSVFLRPPVYIGQGTRIGPGSHLLPYTVIGEGCTIGEGAVVSGSILHRGVYVGREARLYDCIIDEGAVVGAESTLHNMVLAADSLVARGTQSIYSQDGGVSPDGKGTVGFSRT